MKPSEITVNRERLTSDLSVEIEGLLLMHKEEISMFKDVDLGVRWESYFAMESAGILRAYTARNDRNELVGYLVYFVDRHLHYSSIVYAISDVMFLHPDYRKGRNGFKLLKESESDLIKQGVSMFVQNTKKSRDLSRMFERMGYTHMDAIFVKRV